ncbi:uncharacterized protein SCHCODRAFT_01213723 [Schizophyllum commune H4-8]|nr:uncharacterized protein SCHCODRAFT_01213723 [Schizophyllum commune H4-8]KAI5891412.1 hypothetical protein SCHCODRAFT_01213723 [Schizophyllum commune H4-8]
MAAQNNSTKGDVFHPELHALRTRLQDILYSIEHFYPPAPRPPIIDSSVEFLGTKQHEEQWLQRRHTPGLKKLKEAVRVDYDVLDKFLNDPKSQYLPPLSTNAPYLLAVWNEVLCAPPPLAAIFKSVPIAPRKGKETRGGGDEKKAGAAKIDIVAEGGRSWIRVNTIKNARMLAEFREIDSYDTGSSDEDDDDYPVPSLRQTNFDNSVLRLGRSLIAAAQANPSEITGRPPTVVLRLTRLTPDGEDTDPRIGQTIRMLEEMGLIVELGERTSLPPFPGKDRADEAAPSPAPSHPPVITPDINLDLSILIALTSDLTHAPLPTTIEEAEARFIPPTRYRVWRKLHRAAMKGKAGVTDSDLQIGTSTPLGETEETAHDPEEPLPPALEDDDLMKHTRQLTTQVLQEMGCGLFQDMHTQISKLGSHTQAENPGTTAPRVRFWTTREARDRCVRIVMKIGGKTERKRVWAMFPGAVKAVFPEQAEVLHAEAEALHASSSASAEPTSATKDPTSVIGEDAVDLGLRRSTYWRGSRYPLDHVPILPIHIYDASPDEMVGKAKAFRNSPAPSDATSTASQATSDDSQIRILLGPGSAFSRALAHTCRELLAQDVVPHPRTVKKMAAGHFVPVSSDEEDEVDAPSTNGAAFSSKDPVSSQDDRISSQDERTSTNAPTHPPKPSQKGARPAGRTSVRLRAQVTRANPRLTAHTIDSLLYGAALGWTTLTANKTSVKGVMKEMGDWGAEAGASGGASATDVGEDAKDARGSVNGKDKEAPRAALWVVDPRSLGEEMRADYVP